MIDVQGCLTVPGPKPPLCSFQIMLFANSQNNALQTSQRVKDPDYSRAKQPNAMNSKRTVCHKMI